MPIRFSSSTKELTPSEARQNLTVKQMPDIVQIGDGAKCYLTTLNNFSGVEVPEVLFLPYTLVDAVLNLQVLMGTPREIQTLSVIDNLYFSEITTTSAVQTDIFRLKLTGISKLELRPTSSESIRGYKGSLHFTHDDQVALRYLYLGSEEASLKFASELNQAVSWSGSAIEE